MPDAPKSDGGQRAKPPTKSDQQGPAPSSDSKETNPQRQRDGETRAPNDGSTQPPDDLAKAVEAAKAASRLQDTVNSLKEQAEAVKDPAERERLFRAAYEKEVEAHGQSKTARILASGWGQGAGAGAGISAAVGLGLGNLVGVLLSGTIAIPGTLAGAAVGAVHGPWYTLGLGGKEKKEGKGKGEGEGDGSDGSDDDEMHDAIVRAVKENEK